MEVVAAPFPGTAGILQQLQAAGHFPLMLVWQTTAGPTGTGLGLNPPIIANLTVPGESQV